MTKSVKFEGEVKEMNAKYQYSLVVAQHMADDKEGRIHLCRLYDEDLWGVFSVVPRGMTVKEGFSLCRVVEFRLDRNGYTNLVLAPMTYLGKAEVRFSPVWEYLRPLMSTIAYGGKYEKKFNMEALLPETDSLEKLMEKGESYFSWMNQQMLKPSYAEGIAKVWQESFQKDDFREEYPLLAAKYSAPEGDEAHELERRTEFLQRTFKTLGEDIKTCKEQEIFQKCEDLLEMRKAKKAKANKAAKAAKKATKKA